MGFMPKRTHTFAVNRSCPSIERRLQMKRHRASLLEDEAGFLKVKSLRLWVLHRTMGIPMSVKTL